MYFVICNKDQSIVLMGELNNSKDWSCFIYNLKYHKVDVWFVWFEKKKKNLMIWETGAFAIIEGENSLLGSNLF